MSHLTEEPSLTAAEIQKLPLNAPISGKWKIHEWNRSYYPKKKRIWLVHATLRGLDDNTEINDCTQYITCRIWNYPKTEKLPEKNQVLWIKVGKIKKTLGESLEVHALYKNIELLKAEDLMAESTKKQEAMQCNKRTTNPDTPRTLHQTTLTQLQREETPITPQKDKTKHHRKEPESPVSEFEKHLLDHIQRYQVQQPLLLTPDPDPSPSDPSNTSSSELTTKSNSEVQSTTNPLGLTPNAPSSSENTRNDIVHQSQQSIPSQSGTAPPPSAALSGSLSQSSRSTVSGRTIQSDHDSDRSSLSSPHRVHRQSRKRKYAEFKNSDLRDQCSQSTNISHSPLSGKSTTKRSDRDRYHRDHLDHHDHHRSHHRDHHREHRRSHRRHRSHHHHDESSLLSQQTETRSTRRRTVNSRHSRFVVDGVDILDFIDRLFAWTVNHFVIFKEVAHEWPPPMALPKIDPFECGENKFLRLLVESLSSNELHLRDKVDVFAINGDCIVDNMTIDARQNTIRLLRDDEYESLSDFTKVVLVVLNRMIQRNVRPLSESQRHIHSILCQKYDKFPVKFNYKTLGSMVVYHIMEDSLQIRERAAMTLEREQKEFETKCVGHKKVKDREYAKCYAQRICKMCFGAKQVLTHCMAVSVNGENHINICKECNEAIGCGKAYWEFYDSMLKWDKGWRLLFSKECNQQYKCMMGIVSAIIMRNGHHNSFKN